MRKQRKIANIYQGGKEIFFEKQIFYDKEFEFLFDEIGSSAEIKVHATSVDQKNFAELLQCIHCLRSICENKIIIYLPYFPCLRQKKENVLGFYLDIVKKINNCYFLSIDNHYDPSINNIISLDSYSLLEENIKNYGFDFVLFLDTGSFIRSSKMREFLDAAKIEYTFVEKSRKDNLVSLASATARINGKVLVVDDILSTGFTAVSSIEKFVIGSASEVIFLVPHIFARGEDLGQVLNICNKIWTFSDIDVDSDKVTYFDPINHMYKEKKCLTNL